MQMNAVFYEVFEKGIICTIFIGPSGTFRSFSNFPIFGEKKNRWNF